MPAERHERSRRELEIGETHVASFERKSRQPPDRRRLELRTPYAGVEHDEGERVHQAHVAEFTSGHLRLFDLAAVTRALKPAGGRALGGHERMFS